MRLQHCRGRGGNDPYPVFRGFCCPRNGRYPGGNLVRKHNCAVAQSSEFKFEIDKLDVDFRKECGQNFVDFQSVFFYLFQAPPACRDPLQKHGCR